MSATTRMTPDEHRGIYQTISESVVTEPPVKPDEGLDERVQRGALHLDEHYPGWADKINLKTFNLFSSSECVVGQLYRGNYGYNDSSLSKLSHIPVKNDNPYGDDPVIEKWSGEHGFFGKEDEEKDDDKDWYLLQNDWIKAIKGRQT